MIELSRLDDARRALGVATTSASLLRIGVWCAVSLLLIGWAGDRGGYHPPSDDETCPRMRSLMGDPRAFRAAFPRDAKTDFRMAWISGSASFIYRPGEDVDLLPRRVALAFPGDGPASPQALSYVNAATQIYDRYLCLQDALTRDADCIVLTVTPKYLTDPRSAVHMRYQFPSAVTRLPWSRDHWQTYFSLSQPADWLQGAAMEAFPVIRDQADNHLYPRAIARRLTFVNDNASATAAVSAKWADDHAVVPWTAHTASFIGKKIGEYPFPKRAKGPIDVARYTLNIDILEKMLAQLSASRFTVFVYLEPLAPDANEPSFETCAAILESLAPQYTRPGMRILARVPDAWLHGANFKDQIHLADPAPNTDGTGAYTAALATAIWETHKERP